MASRVILLVLLGTAVAQAFILDTFLPGVNQSAWNDLKVTWGINPFTSYNSLPRTQVQAQTDGWVVMDSAATCDSNSHFKGKRFYKDNDMATIVIYDVNGYIAGLQAGFPKNSNPNHYPSSHISPHPMVLDGTDYFITAYFVDPSIICTTGRSATDFHNEGTGTGLWIQNGTDPIADSTKMPHLQSDVDNTMWTKGHCFKTMGVHYWYNVSQSMSCDTMFPVFLLYNGGVLNAFGWAFGLNLHSTRFEHPPHATYSAFMNPVPTCLDHWGTLTTLHIYLTSHYLRDSC